MPHVCRSTVTASQTKWKAFLSGFRIMWMLSVSQVFSWIQLNPSQYNLSETLGLTELRLFYDHSHQQNSFLLRISQRDSQHCRSDLTWSAETSHYIFCPTKDWLRLVGLSACRLEQFKRAINALTAKTIHNERKHDHVTPLHDLHWLRIRQRIQQ